MLQQEVTVAESPQHTDTGHARIACCLNVNIAVSYIYRTFGRNTKLSHSLDNSIGSRFLAYILTLAYSHLNKIAKEVAA